MTNQLRFDGRVVVVTGAGAGLGREYALLFASRGASVVVNDLGGGRDGTGQNSSKAADSVVNEIKKNGGKAVANYDTVLDGDKIIKTAIDMFGRVDVVVNNAGILKDKSFIKMRDTDWDLIQDVHVKGAYKVTHAAWPYFCKQNYGKVIFTTSNSALCGNFGQSNYSTAKMGLIGLTNSLAIEGARKNICVNVIVPTAASRLTQDILPPDFLDQLKPELIAPVVFWLSHEKCNENGSIIESMLGYARKCRIIRSSGCVLRQNLNDIVTPENVEANWAAVTDMSSTNYISNLEEGAVEMANIIDELKEGVPRNKIEGVVSESEYNHRDVILYALGVGATIENPLDFRYLYELHTNFAILPTFYVLFGPNELIKLPILLDAVPQEKASLISPTNILHGEQYMEVLKPLSTAAKVKTQFKVQDTLDKGKGALVLVQHDTFDATNGEKLTTGQMSIFILGAGGFQGKRTSSHVISTVDPPNRKPDASITQKTSTDQAVLYRLNGDINPLHIDANIASMAGFKRPILHGLCSLGFSTRHVLHTYANGDPSLFKAIKVRFSSPVLPGETLRTDMWQDGKRIYFQTSVAEKNSTVITGAYIDLLEVNSNVASQMTPAIDIKNLESDAVFAAIRDFVKSNPDQAKKVNAVFLYNITVNGKQQAQWTLDLKKGNVYRGEPSGKIDTTLTIEDKDMMEIATGKMNAQLAFMKGKLKIAGNIMLTQKLKALMDANKSKL